MVAHLPSVVRTFAGVLMVTDSRLAGANRQRWLDGDKRQWRVEKEYDCVIDSALSSRTLETRHSRARRIALFAVSQSVGGGVGDPRPWVVHRVYGRPNSFAPRGSRVQPGRGESHRIIVECGFVFSHYAWAVVRRSDREMPSAFPFTRMGVLEAMRQINSDSSCAATSPTCAFDSARDTARERTQGSKK